MMKTRRRQQQFYCNFTCMMNREKKKKLILADMNFLYFNLLMNEVSLYLYEIFAGLLH